MVTVTADNSKVGVPAAKDVWYASGKLLPVYAPLQQCTNVIIMIIRMEVTHTPIDDYL